MTRDTWHVARATQLLAFLAPAAVALYLGMVAHSRALVDLDTVAAMGNAWRVFHWQDAANMALIGFDQPPLMALLFVPFAAFAPQSLVSGVAAPILGAIFLGLSVLIIWRLSRSLGLPAWLTAILCAIFTLHPLVLSYAMLGSRGMVLTFVLLGLAASLVSWQREQRVRDVVTGSFFAAAAILLAYETVALVLAGAIYLATCCRGEKDRPAAKAEGLLVAFLLPAAYVAFVWIAANWAIMGNPWHFLPHARTGVCVVRGPEAPLAAALTIWLVVNPLLLALVYSGLRGRGAVGAPAAWLLIVSLFSTMLLAVFLDPYSYGSIWPQYLSVAALAAGAGMVLLIALLAQVRESVRPETHELPLRRVISPGLFVIAVGSIVIGVYLLTSNPDLPLDTRATWMGYPAFAARVGNEWAVADRLKGQWDSRLTHLIRPSETSHVVALRAEARQRVLLDASLDRPDKPWLQPGSFVAYQSHVQGFPEVWQALRPDLALRLRWHIGDWWVYQFGSPRVPMPSARKAANGQPPSSDAIIAPGAPHAHPRR